MPGGRPTKYKEEFAEQAKKLCKLGATDSELANFFNVTIPTIDNWKLTHPKFFGAIKTAKQEADNRVERRLYEKAMGYEQDAVKIFMPASATEPVYAPYREKIAPDTTAAIFWLKNRQKEKWRDTKDHELSGKDGGPIETEEKSDPRGLARKLILSLAQAAKLDE